MSTGLPSPSRPQLSPPLGPINSRIVDLLAALQRVSRQITHPALGQQRQPILVQVCMAAAPLLRNFPAIEPGQIRSASRLALSSDPAGGKAGGSCKNLVLQSMPRSEQASLLVGVQAP
jgi:hypothetical protein